MGRLGVNCLDFVPASVLRLRNNIHFLDNRFDRVATSREVCDAWQKRSEARVMWLCARRWWTLDETPALGRPSWQTGWDVISHLWRVWKVASVGSMSLNLSFSLAPSVATRLTCWRSSWLPRILITGYKVYFPEYLNSQTQQCAPAQNAIVVLTVLVPLCRKS